MSEEDDLFQVTFGKIKPADVSDVDATVCSQINATVCSQINAAVNNTELEREEKEIEQDMLAKASNVVPLSEIKAALSSDAEAQQVMENLQHNQRRKREAAQEKWSLKDGVLYAIKGGCSDKLYVPLVLRNKILEQYHAGDFNMHAGRDATIADIARRYYWKKLPVDAAEFVRRCRRCQLAKAVVPLRQGRLQPTLHEHIGSMLSMDLVGPLTPNEEGYNYILTMFVPLAIT